MDSLEKLRYKIRIHESGEHDGSIAAGTIMLHVGGSSSIEAKSIGEVEAGLRKQIATGQAARGRVYQICPSLGSPELPRCLAVGSEGEPLACFLESAHGLYAEFRRIRFPFEAFQS